MNYQKASFAYAKAHHKELIAKICDTSKDISSIRPFTLFMAGSPGSGKTEYSKSFIKKIQEKDPSQTIIRLDTDELRELLPQYTGKNSDDVQKAATLLFDKAFDYIQAKSLNVIVDTTFASPKAIQNVERALGRNRKVGVLYLYQDPLIAWEYTKKREKLENRTVPKSVFIQAYFKARENVDEVKKLFGNQVELHVFEKDKKNNFVKKAKFNAQSLKEILKEKYTQDKLESELRDDI